MMSNEKGTRAERTQQTTNPAGNFSFGDEAIFGHTQSARRILLLAQAEMRRHHGNENFLTVLGPSAILLAFTGLETFVNYTLYIGARTADVAVSITERKNKLDLLLTDMVMPDVDGPNLAEKILTIHPNAKVIFMSGYPLKTYDSDNLTPGGLPPQAV
jgi:CheY-like chemotaxis protein